MKIKMTAIYDDSICGALKEVFNCETDAELLGVFKGAMKAALEAEVEDTSGIEINCEIVK